MNKAAADFVFDSEGLALLAVLIREVIHIHHQVSAILEECSALRYFLTPFGPSWFGRWTRSTSMPGTCQHFLVAGLVTGSFSVVHFAPAPGDVSLRKKLRIFERKGGISQQLLSNIDRSRSQT